MVRLPGSANMRRRVDITKFNFDQTLDGVAKIYFEGEEFVSWGDASKLVADGLLFFDCDTVTCPDSVSSVEEIRGGSMLSILECAPHIRTPNGRLVRARAIPSADGEMRRDLLYFRLSTLMDKIAEKRHPVIDFEAADALIIERIFPFLDLALIDEMSAYISAPLSLQRLILFDLIARRHVRFYRVFSVDEGAGRFVTMVGWYDKLGDLLAAIQRSRSGIPAEAGPYWPENGINAGDLSAFLAEDAEGYAATIIADNGSALLAPLLGAPLTPQALYLAVDNDATADLARGAPTPAAEVVGGWDETLKDGRVMTALVGLFPPHGKRPADVREADEYVAVQERLIKEGKWWEPKRLAFEQTVKRARRKLRALYPSSWVAEKWR